ncbi:Heat shock 70 kDa protein cognate 4 [Trachymyrmex cornetzi]|uniref:Heat shock 70 kDa protein cognate 4 n=1 Tax=Trachymyrmex cornetzi TaxID=471704 RepID=A0A195DWP0_9HYME|nr:Heat shock 70 kDa protein cognate 4 [Trachymyrmex cornetzi]
MAYSANEYIDMIITYGACGGNGSETRRLYAERFPERKQPNSSAILRCIHRLRETGSVFVTRLFTHHYGGVKRSVYSEEKILRAYEDGKNVCHIARLFGTNRSNVYRILDKYEVRPLQLEQNKKQQRDTCEDEEFFYCPGITDYTTHFGCTVKESSDSTSLISQFKIKYVGEMYIGLFAQCEKVRRMLSSLTQASIEINLLFDSIDFYTSVIRPRYEELYANLFRSILELMALRDTKVDKIQVYSIVLVSDSIRIPKIQKLFYSYFILIVQLIVIIYYNLNNVFYISNFCILFYRRIKCLYNREIYRQGK